MPNGKNPQDQLRELADANDARLAALGRSGVVVDPVSILHARIDSLMDSLGHVMGPSGPTWVIVAKMAFQAHLAEQFNQVETEAGRTQLAQGALFSPAMIAELARETGMFRVQQPP